MKGVAALTLLKARAREWRLYERGVSSVVVFILGMPAFILALGLGIDVLRAGQAKRVIQGRLDVAVQAAAAMTYTEVSNSSSTNGAIRLGTPSEGEAAALRRATEVYAANTDSLRTVGRSRGNLLWCSESDVTRAGITRDALNANPGACIGGPYIVAIPGRPARDFDFCQPPSVGAYGVKYEVIEQIPTLFTQIIPGAPKFFTIRVSSEALLRQQFC